MVGHCLSQPSGQSNMVVMTAGSFMFWNHEIFLRSFSAFLSLIFGHSGDMFKLSGFREDSSLQADIEDVGEWSC